jgi:hypothetical protein
LHGITSVFFTKEETPCHGEHATPVGAYELLERLLVPSAKKGEDACIEVGFSCRRRCARRHCGA